MKRFKIFKIVMIEIGMLLGIVAAAFMVPRSTPLLTLGVISVGVIVLGNILFVNTMRQARDTNMQGLSSERNRRLNLIIVLFAVYWLLCFLLRK